MFNDGCCNGKQLYLNKYDAEKISTNLIFLEEKTINTELLVDKLIQHELLDEKDRIRISQAPQYNHNLEVYLTVLRKGPHAFEILLKCLSQSGNEAVVERLSPQTDFHVIWNSCKKHWPFMSIMLICQMCGSLYWIYRLLSLSTF